MRTYVYVDAFNLYYGSLKGTPYKWLDLQALCKILLPRNDVVRIKYFTARVQARINSLDKPQRQEMYFRALRTIPIVEIIYGHYLSHIVRMPLALPQSDGNQFADVVKTEEKGSDVNLASHMLIDAFENSYQCAVVVSGDSDLKTPVKLVISKFKKTVGVVNPQKVACKALQSEARFYKHIRESALQSSQFPPLLKDASGPFHKPAKWN